MNKMNDNNPPVESTAVAAGGSSADDPYAEGRRIMTRHGRDPPSLGVSATAK